MINCLKTNPCTRAVTTERVLTSKKCLDVTKQKKLKEKAEEEEKLRRKKEREEKKKNIRRRESEEICY